MDVSVRMRKIRLLEKMEKDPGYSKKLGNKDTSIFLYYENTKKTEKGEREYDVCSY